MKLTKELLQKLIIEEKEKFGKIRSTEDVAEETEEVDADEYADTLEKHVDFIKALKIKENRLRSQLRRIGEAKKVVITKIKKMI